MVTKKERRKMIEKQQESDSKSKEIWSPTVYLMQDQRLFSNASACVHYTSSSSFITARLIKN